MTDNKWQGPSSQQPIVPTPQTGKQFTLEQAMEVAVQLQNQGKLGEAEAMLNKVLAFRPDFPPALNLLAVIAHTVGKLDVAINILGKAIEGDKKVPLFHSNRGEMCRIAKRLDEAVYHGRQAVKLDPKMAGAHSNLGIAYFDQEEYDKAETHQKKALVLQPNLLPALNNRGSIFKERKDFDNAVIWYKKALAVNPDFLESLNNIGATLTDDSKAEEALPYLRKAVTLNPNYVEALNNLGRALLQEDEYDQALPAFQKAIQLDNNHCSAHMGIASVMQERQDHDTAYKAASKAVEVEPDRPEAHSMLGRVYVDLGEEGKAHGCYDKALELNPELGSAFNARGSLLLEQGKLDEAEVNFRKGMALETEEGAKMESLFNLAAAIKVVEGSEEHLALVEAEKDIENLSEKKVMLLHFALGKMYDDLKDYNTAFEHYIKACTMKRETYDYDRDEMSNTYKDTIATFTPELLEKLKPYADPSNKSIFVLGSPRSGTTLTEQIIASHPEVFGAGELKDFAASISSMPNTNGMGSFPTIMKDLSPEQLSHIAKDYIRRITERAPDAKYITDKMPANYFYIGLIHTLLPNAKIIHVKRNSLDTCISCFQRLFGHNQYQSYNLTDLGTYYRNYVELMDHWKKILPKGTIHEIQYEDLIADQEKEAKRLIKACGLKWDKGCLEFHKHERSIRTASVTQVRKPIYNTSVEKWRRYAKHLGPLVEALGHAAPNMK